MFNHLFPVNPNKGREDSQFMNDVLSVSYEQQAYNEDWCLYIDNIHTCPVPQWLVCDDCCEHHCECES